MAMLLKQSFLKETRPVHFDLDRELGKHAWRPFMSIIEATDVLAGQPAYTYLLRKSPIRGKFEISFVQPNGAVKHDQLTLVNPKFGIWLNGHGSHLGTLAKVIRDMMDCEMHLGQPL